MPSLFFFLFSPSQHTVLCSARAERVRKVNFMWWGFKDGAKDGSSSEARAGGAPPAASQAAQSSPRGSLPGFSSATPAAAAATAPPPQADAVTPANPPTTAPAPTPPAAPIATAPPPVAAPVPAAAPAPTPAPAAPPAAAPATAPSVALPVALPAAVVATPSPPIQAAAIPAITTTAAAVPPPQTLTPAPIATTVAAAAPPVASVAVTPVTAAALQAPTVALHAAGPIAPPPVAKPVVGVAPPIAAPAAVLQAAAAAAARAIKKSPAQKPGARRFSSGSGGMSGGKETGIDIHRAADRGTFRDVCKYVEMGGDVNARDKSQVDEHRAAFPRLKPARALYLSCLFFGKEEKGEPSGLKVGPRLLHVFAFHLSTTCRSFSIFRVFGCLLFCSCRIIFFVWGFHEYPRLIIGRYLDCVLIMIGVLLYVLPALASHDSNESLLLSLAWIRRVRRVARERAFFFFFQNREFHGKDGRRFSHGSSNPGSVWFCKDLEL